MNEIDEEFLEKISSLIEKLRNNNPLTHCITNFVTVNDCANAVLAIGGSPAMANATPEIKEFVEVANSVVINIGTLVDDQIEAMDVAAKHTKKTNTPLVLDPVAVGVTTLRNNTTLNIINNSSVSIIRGNMSEIKAIANLLDILEDVSPGKGVDVSTKDTINENNLVNNVNLVKSLANKIGCVVDVSGVMDIISDGTNTYIIDNGDEIMTKITGSGCMLSSIIGSFAAISNSLEASLIGSLTMAIAGERASLITKNNNQGTLSFRTHLIDELSKMNKNTILESAKIYTM